jgi:hypothetical protein
MPYVAQEKEIILYLPIFFFLLGAMFACEFL